MSEFSVVELIRKTRDGVELNDTEISFLVSGFSKETIPDYQISAWLMAVCLKGLSVRNTFHLTRLMRDSGAVMDWRRQLPDRKNLHIVDKHSTGGIGDKVSFILMAISAAMEMQIPMIGGRGLGHTGGTVDKLDSIPGFKSILTVDEVRHAFEEIGCYIISQSEDICPADKKLYSLRDVTGTVESLELITASIVSKKWSEGLDGIVFDVKCGCSAFMEDIEHARSLARSLVGVCKQGGMNARALITHMEEPLGAFVGNALEIKESLMILSGEFENDQQKKLAQPLTDLCLELAAHMAVVSGLSSDLEAMRELAREKLASKSALEKFTALMRVQGAKSGWQDMLPKASRSLTITSDRSGFIKRINGRIYGLVGIKHAMGRKQTEDQLDYGVGFETHVARGDKVEKNQPLVTFFYNKDCDLTELTCQLRKGFDISDTGSILDSLVIELIS